MTGVSSSRRATGLQIVVKIDGDGQMDPAAAFPDAFVATDESR
jgi:hypothetical protein